MSTWSSSIHSWRRPTPILECKRPRWRCSYSSSRRPKQTSRRTRRPRRPPDAQVAQEAQQYAAAAAKAGGGSGVFAWPIPACGFACITQGFGCSTFYLEVYDASCPWPHKIHTGIDIAAGYGTPIVAADTGVAYLYPGSVGYGNLLVIIHGNGYSTYYGHTAGYAPGLTTGQVVPRGTTVAFEGS
ncbi:MAG: M23 family metallopeptidase, partial [Chloroflexi bacterium]